MSTRMNRRAFLKVTAGAAALGGAAGRPVRSEAQDKRTLVVAWDTDIVSKVIEPARLNITLQPVVPSRPVVFQDPRSVDDGFSGRHAPS